jgi:precorrin-2 dehydrogenase / sirohydrochlorin ferrochelatase
MAVFPLFIELSDKKCVVVGGGEVAARKVEVLVDFGAQVTVVSPEVKESILSLEAQGKINVCLKEFNAEDMDGAFIVIAATSDEEVNRLVWEGAARSNIFVNVADCPERCTFIFPAIVKRGDLVIGISTAGGFPALSKGIREKLDRMFPRNYGDLLIILKEYRKKASIAIKDRGRRVEFLKRIAGESFLEDNTAPDYYREKIAGIFKEYGDEQDNQNRITGK